MSIADPQTPFCRDDVVLVADDEDFTRYMTAEILDRLGHPRTIVARNGAEAVAALSGELAGAIRLVLLDFDMPEPNGIEVLKAIRSGSLGVAADVLVMMVTGNDSFDLMWAAMILDADAFLAKPLKVPELRELLTSLAGADREIAPAETYADIDVSEMRRHRQTAPIEAGEPVTVAELAIGMVIVANVLTPTGALLLAAGTVVTGRLVRLLRGLVAGGLPLGDILVRA